MESKSVKTVIVGHSGVGKTSIINRYIFGSFDQVADATLGAVFHEKMQQSPNSPKVKLQIWDTAGQQRYRSIAKIYYKDAKVILAVYDVTSENSFKQLKSWISEVKNNAARNTRIIVIGNKIDLIGVKMEDSHRHGEVGYQQAQGYCRSIGAELRLVSAKSSKGVLELFETVAEKGTQVIGERIKNEQDERTSLQAHRKAAKNNKSCCI